MRKCIIRLLLVLLPGVSAAAEQVLTPGDREALSRLGLQEQQWRKIDALVSSSRERIQTLQSEEKSISEDLRRISAGDGDASKIPALAGRRATLAADRLKVRAGVKTELNSILTPEQSDRLKHILDRRVPVSIEPQRGARRAPQGAWPMKP